MNLDRVGPGERVPEEINVIIEFPMNADPIKYEVDKKNRGAVRGSLHDDGDALSL